MAMIKTLCCAAAIVLLALQDKANPDLKYEKEAGISVSRPPKNDEWDFKEKGQFAKAPKIVIAHKVDELWIEIIHIPPQPLASFDNKKQAEADFAGWSGIKGITDVKRISLQASKLPAGGGGGANGWFYEATFKAGEKPVEFREWVFVGRENQCQYIIMLHGDEGMYKKHQKEADLILGSIKTWKVPK